MVVIQGPRFSTRAESRWFIESGAGVRAVDVFAEFERNLVPFKQLVHEALENAANVSGVLACTHCQPHEGVTLPIELP
jgi:5'-methylthioadenosine phosphorylase